MPTIISLILIFLCIIIVIAIIIKKLPALAILDVNNIAGAKEAKFKEDIIKQRLERDLNKMGGLLGRLWLFVHDKINNFVKSTQSNLRKRKAVYRSTDKMSVDDKQKRIKTLLVSAEELIKDDEFNMAEEKLIEAVGLDEKNLQAFFQLAELYYSTKKWVEARQTYTYALKLAKQYKDEKDVMGELSVQQIYFCLANLEKDADNIDESLDHVREALELEPNNPRYLDLILDLSIMKKDKDLAIEFFQKLREVNPENNKLTELAQKIESLDE